MSPAPQTAGRQRELGGSFKARTRREAGISITDMNHHVTEAIGDMYGDDEDWKRESINGRPMSFMPSPTRMAPETDDNYFSNSYGTPPQPAQAPGRTGTLPVATRPQLQINGGAKKAQTMPGTLPSQRNGDLSNSTPPSPSHSLRENRSFIAESNQPLPLGDFNYNGDPAEITKELNNLQALRRMSMDVGNTSDPDLPSFGGISIMPSVAPTGDDDEDDPSRLFWVPARVHPELAPMEFKSFLENRVKTIKRRSGESAGTLSPDILERSGSQGSLRRKKSMLSRQIDNSGGRGAVGYQDGADKLERRKSTLNNSTTGPELKLADLTELDELVKDPTKAMQKLALERGSYENSNAEVPASEDMPILPAAPGIGLRRSTHTTYRKGSLRRGERVPYSKRAAQAGIRAADTDAEDSASSAGAPSPGIKRVFSEPVAENFSRPGRRRGAPTNEEAGVVSESTQSTHSIQASQPHNMDGNGDDNRHFEQPQKRSMSLRQVPASPRNIPVPQIVETPPVEEDSSGDGASDAPKLSPQYPFPERSSSYSASSPTEPPPRSSRRPQMQRQQSSVIDQIPKAAKANADQQQHQPQQRNVSSDLQQSISSSAAVNNASTDDLTFIPNLPASSQKASEMPRLKKSSERERDKDDNESTSSKKSWFSSLRSDGSKKDKKRAEKEKEREKEREDDSKRGRVKASLEKVHDNARLDVLQQAVEHTAHRGRESLLLDRESVENKLTTERSKESNRKSGKEEKKEKEGLFGGLFGGRKKADRESGGKKSNSSLRAPSPEPARRLGRPDVDYQWTRFSLLEERAIYRMAHIKLANPRRPLHSQVLLSNFMYAYLAKVQQMNPHVQIPQSAAQKKQIEAEKKAKEEQRKREEETQRQEQQQYYDQHVSTDSPFGQLIRC